MISIFRKYLPEIEEYIFGTQHVHMLIMQIAYKYYDISENKYFKINTKSTLDFSETNTWKIIITITPSKLHYLSFQLAPK